MIIVCIALLGVVFGSFVNALVWRLHEQAELGSGVARSKAPKIKITPKDLSILRGRSMCPDCHHTLAVQDLIPVLSWLMLGGKCRYCHSSISWQYPVVEICTGALFALSYVWWPLTLHGVGLFQFVLWLVFVVGFVALAVYDIRWMLLPDRVVLPLTALAALLTPANALWQADWTKLYLPALSATIIFGLFWGIFQVSKGKWIGGGDVKLAIVLGLLAGTPLHAFLVIFLASLLGTIASVPMLVRSRGAMSLRIPFGPYLLLATVVVVLYGASLVGWYQNLLLP